VVAADGAVSQVQCVGVGDAAAIPIGVVAADRAVIDCQLALAVQDATADTAGIAHWAATCNRTVSADDTVIQVHIAIGFIDAAAIPARVNVVAIGNRAVAANGAVI